ncbi:MAG: hypothetical protein J6S67_00055 [Methanobrevibacter sp.]|nr:hypothetical protein [Methanobrevibacter sp.]
MKKIILIFLILAWCFSPFIRMFVTNIFKSIYYVLNDIYDYVVKRKWREWPEKMCGIYNFVGYFGKGKTLSATAYCLRVVNRMKKYGKKVRVISNYEIKGVDYIPLENFEQIVEISKIALSGTDPYCGTLIMIDEIELLLNNRKFASFPLELLSTICQQRKSHVCCLTTLQRWHQCDKAWRDLSLWCVDCTKIWRFQRLRFFDAWDVENATQQSMVQCKHTEWFFVENKHYNAYDTTRLISDMDAKNFISTEESLQRRAVDALRNDECVRHASKRLRRKRKIGA